ncbi:MAG: Limonene dehydrogenase CtmA [Deltaproteobacteria bacterium]|nr:Limonene dehydrogenase CtmA [Deltaproteobacteria bacterium]
MKDYDVVIVGGGINGLTTAAYLAKAGLSVAVFEARGQCGAHCDTIELGRAGFLHNTHAQMLVPAISPAMSDLELERFGLELRGTDGLFATTYLTGKNLVMSHDPAATHAAVARACERDGAVHARIGQYLMEHTFEALDMAQYIFRAPSVEALQRRSAFYDGLLHALGLPLRGEDVMRMTGFEVMEVLYESDQVRTMLAAWGEYTGQWPVHQHMGWQAMNFAGFAPTPVHTARGGSHALTHALVRCLVHHGGDIWTTCPVDKILVRDGRACGVRLSPDALFPDEEINARLVISNLTLVPTFVWCLGAEVIGSEWVEKIKRFNYDDPQLIAVLYALKGDVEFASAAYDPVIQRSWVGYFGGENIAAIRQEMTDCLNGKIADEIMGGWFIPTRADPSQAPPGCHTMEAWVSVPPCPQTWGGRKLRGWDAWPEITEPLADTITDRFAQYAPGFKDLILERHVVTPYEMERNNPSAIRGNMIGGSALPEQSGINRPLPGIITRGVSRSFVPGLYLSNSIEPFGATHLAAGYLTACEVAEDLGCREAVWWQAQPYVWFFENMGRIPLNLGVGAGSAR